MSMYAAKQKPPATNPNALANPASNVNISPPPTQNENQTIAFTAMNESDDIASFCCLLISFSLVDANTITVIWLAVNAKMKKIA